MKSVRVSSAKRNPSRCQDASTVGAKAVVETWFQAGGIQRALCISELGERGHAGVQGMTDSCHHFLTTRRIAPTGKLCVSRKRKGRAGFMCF